MERGREKWRRWGEGSKDGGEGRKEKEWEGGSPSCPRFRRQGEGRNGEVEVTPTLEQSCLWAEPVAELGWFGFQVPLPPQRSPVLPPWETRGLPRAGTYRVRGAGPWGPKPEDTPLDFPGSASSSKPGALVFTSHQAPRPMQPARLTFPEAIMLESGGQEARPGSAASPCLLTKHAARRC